MEKKPWRPPPKKNLYISSLENFSGSAHDQAHFYTCVPDALTPRYNRVLLYMIAMGTIYAYRIESWSSHFVRIYFEPHKYSFQNLLD